MLHMLLRQPSPPTIAIAMVSVQKQDTKHSHLLIDAHLVFLDRLSNQPVQQDK